MNRSLYNIIAGGVLAMAAAACTGAYEDINSHPYQPDDLSADDYALSSSMYNICNTVMSNDVNQYQFVESLMGCTLGGYFSDGNGNFIASFAHYNPANNWSRVFMESNSNSVIPQLYTNISMIQGYSETSGNPVPAAIAQVVKVAAMSRVTDCYGPIPYSMIGEDGNIQTPYDSQKDVYYRFFEELTEASTTLYENRGLSLNPLIDDVYRGDISKWVKLANSLKLRLAMRISYADPSKAKQMAEEAVAAPGGLMESVDDNATYKHYSTGGNPTYSSTVAYGNDSRPAADIVCYMNGYNDPRRAKYFTNSGWTNADGTFQTDAAGNSMQYLGVRRGWTSYDREGWALKLSQIGVAATDPTIWMTASEVAFLRAEGAAVFGWSMGGSAESFYNTGIRLSFEQYGVDGADAYIADATSVPATFYDPANANSWSGSLPTVTIKWDESATTEQKQERIIVQKWIANWTLGNEAWAERRRTGYPALIPIGNNMSGGVVDTDKGPQRMPYPQEEYTNNAPNVRNAVQTLLGGADNMATKLWWAAKPGI